MVMTVQEFEERAILLYVRVRWLLHGGAIFV